MVLTALARTQPVITGFIVRPPGPDTPPYILYERLTWPDRWDIISGQTTNFCKEVEIRFLAQANKTYWIEVGFLHRHRPWEPATNFSPWRICSTPLTGNGEISWRGGMPYAVHYFRIGQQ